MSTSISSRIPPDIASLAADLIDELFAAGGNEAAVIDVLRHNHTHYGEQFPDLLLIATTVLFTEHTKPEPTTKEN